MNILQVVVQYLKEQGYNIKEMHRAANANESEIHVQLVDHDLTMHLYLESTNVTLHLIEQGNWPVRTNRLGPEKGFVRVRVDLNNPNALEQIGQAIQRQINHQMIEKVWGEPNYYAFIDCSLIHTQLYDGLPRNEFGKIIYLIEFAQCDLEAPQQEPIGVYHYAGIRRYLWRDVYWNEYHIDYRYFMDRTKELLQSEVSPKKAMEYRKLLDMLQNYATMPPMNLSKQSVRAFGQEKLQIAPHYWRIIYKINQK